MRKKGKHSTVFLLGGFAIKIFSREVGVNAQKEFRVLKKIKKFAFAPKPYFRLGRVVIMERVNGKNFKEMREQEIRRKVPEFLLALNKLDKLRINKGENHRPLKHFIVTKNGIKLIDFERANEGSHNVTQFLSYLNKFYFGIIKLGKKYRKNLDLRPILKFISAK